MALLIRQRDRLMATFEMIKQSAGVFRKIAQVGDEIAAETRECDLRRSDDEKDAEQSEVHKVNEHERKECAVIAQIGLVFRNHPSRKSEMERPRGADDGEQKLAVRRDVGTQTGDAVNRDGDDAVEREKIRSERDPEIAAVGNNVAAIAPDAKPADASAHEHDPECMRKFVAKNINDDRPRQSDKRDQPKHRAEKEKPELGPGPKSLRKSGARKPGKKRLGENGAPGKKKNGDDIFDPAGGNRHRHRAIRRASRGGHDVRNDFDPRRLFAPAMGRRRSAAWRRRHETLTLKLQIPSSKLQRREHSRGIWNSRHLYPISRKKCLLSARASAQTAPR